jgi:hypothetical protein
MEDDVQVRDEIRYGFGLTEPDVRRLQDIMRRECGVELTLEQAWARGIELLSFAKLLLESLPPKRS